MCRGVWVGFRVEMMLKFSVRWTEGTGGCSESGNSFTVRGVNVYKLPMEKLIGCTTYHSLALAYCLLRYGRLGCWESCFLWLVCGFMKVEFVVWYDRCDEIRDFIDSFMYSHASCAVWHCGLPRSMEMVEKRQST